MALCGGVLLRYSLENQRESLTAFVLINSLPINHNIIPFYKEVFC